MGCIVCCPAVYLVGLLPWQPAPDWPGSPCGPWMQRSAAGYYPGRPDTVQKLCAPAGSSHSHRDPAPPGQRPSQVKGHEAVKNRNNPHFYCRRIPLLDHSSIKMLCWKEFLTSRLRKLFNRSHFYVFIPRLS